MTLVACGVLSLCVVCCILAIGLCLVSRVPVCLCLSVVSVVCIMLVSWVVFRVRSFLGVHRWFCVIFRVPWVLGEL